jgi:hypothetical protein
MNNSLRELVAEILWIHDSFGLKIPEDFYPEADQILNLIASKMPKKKEIDIEIPDTLHRNKGWNAYHNLVKSILKGEESQ